MAYWLGLLKMVPNFLIIINMSINPGIVAVEMKFARVRPIFKKNSLLDVSNYRPVNIHSIVSKILERSIST